MGRAWGAAPGLAWACLLALATCLPAGGTCAVAADWPGWRGPNRDGTTTEVPDKLPEARKAEPDAEATSSGAPAGGKEAAEKSVPRAAPLWRRPATGKALAGIAVSEGCVVVPGYGQKKDIYRCFTADKGESVWEWTCGNAREMDYGPSPRATPLVREGKVYVLGSAGDLACLDLKKGTPAWKLNLCKAFGAEVPKWGFSSSPLVADGKLIVNPGAKDASVAALDPATGKVLWKTPGKGPAYASFIFGELGGARQIVGWDAASLGGWDPATGKRLWTIPCEGDPQYIVPSPVAWNGKVLVIDSRSTRLYEFDKSGQPTAKPAALTEDLTTEMATPTLVKDMALLTGNGLIALDLPAGLKRLWTDDKEEGFMSFSHIVAGNGRAMVFAEDGTVSLVGPEKAVCRILGTVKLCGRTWSHPALADGKLYARDERFLYCFSLK